MSESGDLIKRSRKILGLTQCELADIVGVSDVFISQMENAICLMPVGKADIFSESLKIPLGELLLALRADMLKKIDGRMIKNKGDLPPPD